MREKGMGRTRLGRFAAVTVPATALSLGFGVAILQGSVSAAIASANPITVAGASATGTGLELSLREAQAATSDTDKSASSKGSALVTLKGGQLSTMCLAANQSVPVLGNIGLNISSTTPVTVGDIDMSATSVTAATATLPSTFIGKAEGDLTHQGATATNVGGFGMESAGNVSLSDLNAQAYGLQLANGLTINSLSIVPTVGTTATC